MPSAHIAQCCTHVSAEFIEAIDGAIIGCAAAADEAA